MMMLVIVIVYLKLLKVLLWFHPFKEALIFRHFIVIYLPYCILHIGLLLWFKK